jgi:hypothetical protein
LILHYAAAAESAAAVMDESMRVLKEFEAIDEVPE